MLEFYIPTTSKVRSGLALICDRAHSWQLYSAAPLGNQAAGTMTQYSTQLPYPDTEPASVSVKGSVFCCCSSLHILSAL